MSKIVARKFIEVSIVYLLIGCVWGAIMTLPSVHKFNEAGPARIIIGMHSHWNLLGWVSMAVMGIIYYLVLAFTGKDRSIAYGNRSCRFALCFGTGMR